MSTTLDERERRASEDALGAPAEIRGLVDAFSPDRLHGWAWNATRPEERVKVELRLGDAVVACTVADFARPDLAKAGVGDGCHAFELPLTPESIEHRSDLSVVARAADGTEAPIAVRVRRRMDDGPAGLRSALEALAAGQRALREEVRAVAARLPAVAPADMMHGLEAAQRDLADRLETLSVWLTRVDERLAALPNVVPPDPPRRRVDAWQVVLAAVLSAVASASLAGTVLWLGR